MSAPGPLTSMAMERPAPGEEDPYTYWDRRMAEVRADDDRSDVLAFLSRACHQISPDGTDRDCGDLVPDHPALRAVVDRLLAAGLVRLAEVPWLNGKALKFIATDLGRKRMREAFSVVGVSL